MKKFLLFSGMALAGGALRAQTLVHYWNFNNSASEAALLDTTTSLAPGASIVHVPGGSSAIQITSNTTGQGFEITNPNAREGDAAGAHLRLNLPIGAALVFSLPTTGYENAVVKYGTRRSGSGAGEQYIEYSTDGTNFVPFDTLYPVDGDPTLATLDFSALTAVDNNPNFKLRITFGIGSGGNAGNNRFDNFTLDADVQGAADVTAPVVTLVPATGSTNVPVNTPPTIGFNEAVRLINNNALDNNTVDAVVELRLNNASGALVPFDATITGNVITVVPSAPLTHNQTYYVALLPNTVEDVSDNALTTTQVSTFTTITQQTAFGTGDLLFVAYRSSANGAEDEVAFLSFVDILPGTQVTFTDSKYTTGQCPNGILWTSPANECIAAGTVVNIQPNALLTDKGTVTGGSFGLSSSGDQVIVYTGTSAAPAYITAFSSNAWVTNNASCGGSLSNLPPALASGTDAISLSAAPGNASGNSANAYYNGPQTGSVATLKAAILDPANWIVSGANTAPQTWPVWSFPGAPGVTEAQVRDQTTIRLIFSNDLETASATNTANYTGIAGLGTATVSNNGSAPDTVTLSYSTPFAQGSTYTLTVENIGNTGGLTMACPYTFSFSYNTTVSLVDEFLSVSEGADSVTIRLLVENPAAASADLVLKASPFSNTDASDLTFGTQTVSLGIGGIVEVTIPIIDDNMPEQDEYFVLELQNAQAADIGGTSFVTVYIRDNDNVAPAASEEIELNLVSSFTPVGNNSTCEIVVHDPATQRLFMTSAIQDRLDIADFSNPAAVTLISSVDMSPYGGITSVAVKNGVVAVASPNANEQLDGSVVFFDTDGNFLSQVTVGALPDMITFTPDGQKVLTANEGQPNDAYTVDPEGSVSIIDLSGGAASVTQANVNTLLFTGFNSQETALINSGVRKLKASSTLSQDFEPEYISIAPDGQTAWVTLQENNAIGVIDLSGDSLVSVLALGTKNIGAVGNGFDASDNSGTVHLSNWPVKAFYIPDAVANFQVDGETYLITANEGDEKEYGGLNERTTVGAANLDSTAFPHAAMLKKSHNLGRLRITNLNGDTDNDGDFDELYVNGSRSFSIRKASDMSLVYDSGDEFERITASHPEFGAIFNADNESNAFKGRSRAKGPEPEGVAVARIGNSTFAFVALERIGGVMVYNVSDPGDVQFVDYKNNRSTTAYEGDLGPESVIYIKPENSPDNKHYILVSNEISGSVTVFEVLNTAPAFSLGNDTAFCAGGSVTLTAPAGYGYAWSNGQSTQSITVNTSNTYSVDVTAINGNTSTDSVTVTVNPLPTVSFTGLDTQYEVIDLPVTLTGTPAGGTFDGTGVLGGNQFWPSNAGVGGPYTVTYTYTDSTTGCSAAHSATVSVTEVDDTDIDEAGAAAAVSIFPNPTADVVNIRLELPAAQAVQIDLVDLQGRTLTVIRKENVASGQAFFSLHKQELGLTPGIYLLSVKTEGKQTLARVIFL